MDMKKKVICVIPARGGSKGLKNKKVKKSYEYIIQQEPFTYENLIKLTEIEAPPFKEQNRAIEFKHMIEEIGIDSVWIDLVR